MSDESAAEKVYEAGLELINPGGRPDELRLAAKGWRDLHQNLRTMFEDMDREVQRTLGTHWRGEAADAFSGHWTELTSAVHQTLPQLTEAANSLDEAADAIEEINEEIHRIYLEIGVSIGISVGLSFVTMGFSAAAGAARAAQLAARAAELAKTLGTILRKVGQAFKTISQLAKQHRFLKNVLVNWASNTGATVMTSGLTGQEVDLGAAVWQGGLASVTGTGPALGVTGAVAGKWGGLAGDVVGGAAGNVTGGLAVDGVRIGIANTNDNPGDDVNAGDVLWNAGVNAVAGGAGGAAVHGANTQVPPHRESPHFTIEGIVNGITYGTVGATSSAVKEAVGDGASDGESEAVEAGPRTESARNVKDVFG